jgi:hypothetical protein
MSPVQRIAQVFGIVFILVAVLGFVTSGMSMEADPATAPKLLGLFPVNVLHNVVHLLFGVWGLAAARTFGGAATYGRLGGIIYVVLVALAFVSPNLFGLVPIGGHNIWLHAVLGVALVGAGFTARAAPPATMPR